MTERRVFFFFFFFLFLITFLDGNICFLLWQGLEMTKSYLLFGSAFRPHFFLFSFQFTSTSLNDRAARWRELL